MSSAAPNPVSTVRDSPATRARPPEIPALNGLRFLAALQLFLFHILAFHKMPGAPFKFAIFDALPQWVVNLIERGYCSTSLFFLLSGFILAYLYLDDTGQLVMPSRQFWRARAARIYPLHLVLLTVAALPTLMMAKQFGLTAVDVVVSGLLSAGLLQAWSPRFALSWNFPTWALSVVVFFYAVFPWLAPCATRWSSTKRRLALFLLPLISLIPSLIYLAVRGSGQPAPQDWWSELLMRNPLLWLPHFVMGLLLARVYRDHQTVGAAAAPGSQRSWLSLGDLSAVVVVGVQMLPQQIPAGWLGESPRELPGFVLRHGLLAPLYYLVILDLAGGRGAVAKFLALRFWKPLGDASFSLFMWQLPGLMLFPGIAAALQLSPSWQLLLVVGGTIGLALASCRWIERPLARRILSR
ncbi:MAG: acyltransferase family protein [Planctomycetota bacterium]